MKKEQAPNDTYTNAKSTENQCFYLVEQTEKISNSMTDSLAQFSKLMGS